MKTMKAHKGSALLIVLGMLSFMVVSAVAFSAYMRSARLPSSYLRRTVSSRLLVKAALAEAMERLDFAIADNPYPGAGDKYCTSETRREALDPDIERRNRNIFYHNVFVGDNSWMDAEDTVSTLTLEGLAYIPPPLVNDVRHISRLTPTATWHQMYFDSGRYAYTAIDVSDCFDVNRIKANNRRNSANDRISLAYLFENADHTGYAVQPSVWDTFMNDYLKADRSEVSLAASPGMVDPAKMPLVSVADLNLAIGPSGSSFSSPFCKYIENNLANFYGVSSKDATEAAKIRNMMFVTDSWYPGDAAGGTSGSAAVLSQKSGSNAGQPFTSYPSSGSDISQLDSRGTDGKAKLLNRLSVVDMATLYDYLDADSVPSALALPTVEAAPMICGIAPEVNLNISTRSQVISTETTEEKSTRVTGYYLDDPGLVGGLIKVAYVYPFAERPGSYELDARICFFFTDDGNKSFRDWSALKPANDGDFSRTEYANGIFYIANTQNLPVSVNNPGDDSPAVNEVNIQLQGASSFADKFTQPVFTVTEEMEIDPESGDPIPDTAKIIAAHCNICPVDAAGNVIEQYATDAQFKGLIEGNSGGQFALKMAVCLRIKDGGKTVDLVPATMADDSFNGLNNTMWEQVYDGASGAAMRFDSGAAIKYTRDDFKDNTTAGASTIAPAAIICPDPRYNYAPENWMETSTGGASAWKSYVDGILGQGGRDADIWMAVSDQEQLQSIYEIAMLPRVTTQLDGNRDLMHGNLEAAADSRTAYATGIGGLRHGDKMWTTYRAFANNGATRDNLLFDYLEENFVSGDTSARVNPYASSLTSLLAAFANTPAGWRYACTNVVQNSTLSDSDIEARTFNEKYAYNSLAGNTNYNFEWADLEEIALNFQEAARERARAGEVWEDAWDGLGWDAGAGGANDFCGVPLSGNTKKLSTVERKFLYGFWRESFANRQQLFLIFVRAEPAMMGGGAVGATPPQLGARAVALVWRDPETATPNNPHRMRVLFYRQLD